MGMRERWFMMASTSHQPTYHGIPVYIDSAYLPHRGGPLSDRTSDTDWFIAGPFDTGSADSKAYAWWGARGIGTDSAWRTYNDKSGESVGYWASSFADGTSAESTCTTAGRYIFYSVYKPIVDQLYLKQGDTYIFRGVAE